MTTELPKEGLLRWPIEDIVPSPFQERRDFEPGALAELAQSIQQHLKELPTLNGPLMTGIIQPLTVRRVKADGPLELVCGERRLRAGKLAGQKEVPILLRILNDTEAENIVLTENIQREDLKPSEEARSYDRLLKLRDQATGQLIHTRESVAKLACKTLNHIDDHLKLLACPPVLQEAVDRDEVALSVAMVVGRIPDPKLRPAAAAKVLKPDYQETPMNFKQAKELVREEFMVSLANAPWKLDDATLVPERFEEREGVKVRCFGGRCIDCPMLSGNIDGVQITAHEKSRTGADKRAGGSAGNLCTLPKCHQAKLDAVCKQQREAALAKGLKVLDDKEAEKQFSPSRSCTANGAKYVVLDFGPEYHEVGSLSYNTNNRKWRGLLKGSEVATVMGRNPHTGLLVEMALLKEAKPVGEKALRARTPEKKGELSPAELKEEEDRKKRRAAELLKEKIDKLAVKEGLIDILAHIERKGADAGLLAKFVKLSLDRAGSDGVRFLVKHLEIPIDEKKKPWERHDEESILKHAETFCGDRVHAWNGMLALVLMSWSVSFNGLGSEAFKVLAKECGVDIGKLQQRAKVMLEAEKKAKPVKKDAGKAPTKNSVDPVKVSAEKEQEIATAADKRHKEKSGPSQVEIALGIQESKLGKATGWTPADVEAGAKLLKAKSHDITALIGSKPDAKKDDIAYKNWNGLRMKLLRKAGLAK